MGELTLRPVAPGDVAALRRIRATPEVRRWWGDPEPDWLDADADADAATRVTRRVVALDGAVAGLVQFTQELDPRYRHAAVDVFLDPARHGRGLGTEVVGRVVAELVHALGHHRVTIDPAADNAAAIRCYEKVGFTAVGVMRAYERDVDGDGWHDALLMQYSVEHEQP